MGKVKNMQQNIERFQRKNYSPRMAVSIARTVEFPQPDFEDLLHVAGRELGRLVKVREITNTRITFLQSGGVDRAMKRARNYDNKKLRSFVHGLGSKLDEHRHYNLEVQVDEHRPLIFIGRNRDKLALNIVPDDRLMEERENIEDALREEFGEVPKMRPFNPHITIGEATKLIDESQKKDPCELFVEEGLVIPDFVVLNGLNAYLDQKSLSRF